MTRSPQSPRRFSHLALGIAMLAAAAAAIAMTPRAQPDTDSVELEALLPDRIGEWRRIETGLVQMDLAPRRDGDASIDNPYDQTLLRTYAREDGALMMVALAYGARQRQEVKIHRPELCYVAQGFRVSDRSSGALTLADGGAVTATRLLAQSDRRIEPVTYWIRIGDQITQSAWQSRATIFRAGLLGRIPDGILVRVSQAFPPGNAPLERSYALQEEFLRALVGGLDARGRTLVTGGAADAAARAAL